MLQQRVAALVQQENRDRMVIIRRVIQLDRQLSERDLPAVKRVFYRLTGGVVAEHLREGSHHS